MSMIRRATPEDANAVAALFERSFGTLDFLPTLHTAAENRSFFARALSADEGWVYGARGRMLGFAVLSGDVLSHLYVEPDTIGQGVGHALFEHATEQRPEGFEFWVFQQNERARAFYERHGCRAVRFTDGSGNEERAPDVLYEWRP
jgi:ribosomal protein S18 acetylase RimI-like enzyme